MTKRAALLCLACLAAPAFSLGAQELGRDVLLERNVMIPMRDGVRLATDIYRPAVDGRAVEGRRPLVLQRTPYGKSTDRFLPQALAFAARGYVVALQDFRGRYDSEGAFLKYDPLDAPDGYDTVEWLAKLPYVDGRVAMWGTSFAAHAGADAAKMNPPHLAGLVLNEGGLSNPWDHAIRQGGAFELGRELTWAFRQIPLETDDPVVRAHFENEHVEDWYQALPFRPGLNPLSIAPNFEAYILEEMTHSDYDDYWKGMGMNWEEYYAGTADVPMVHIGGWYDIFLRGTLENYVELSRMKSSPMRLVVGPWTHSGNARTYAGDVDFGADAAIRGLRHRLPARVVRPPARAERGHGGGKARPPLRDGDGGWREGRGRTATPWGLLDGGRWMAPPRRLADAVLPPRRRHPVDRGTGRDPGVDDLHLRSRAPRSHTRRQRVRAGEGRRLRPARAPRLRGQPSAVPAALVAPRRGGLPDRAARRGRGGGRAHHGHALRVQHRGRHRLHGEAPGRLPAQRGLPVRASTSTSRTRSSAPATGTVAPPATSSSPGASTS